MSFNDRFENLPILDVLPLKIPEIGNAHAGKAHKTKEVSCPDFLGGFEPPFFMLAKYLRELIHGCFRLKIIFRSHYCCEKHINIYQIYEK
ncbi:MAG: hypothetical protein M0P47_13170, partial [Bacteroidales bacterium]|nr:hypothetical protein [Bacteroidales bacterium]